MHCNTLHYDIVLCTKTVIGFEVIGAYFRQMTRYYLIRNKILFSLSFPSEYLGARTRPGSFIYLSYIFWSNHLIFLKIVSDKKIEKKKLFNLMFRVLVAIIVFSAAMIYNFFSIGANSIY